MKFFKTILMPSLLLVVLVASHQLEVSGTDTAGSDIGDPGRSNRGFFGALLSPLRETLRHAKQLLGRRVEDVDHFVQDNFDQIQVQAFKLFTQMYKKTYSPEEIPKRMKLFVERRKTIEESVRAFSEGKLPFMMRENSYTDWDEKELKALAGASPPKSIHELTAEERELIFGKDEANLGRSISEQEGSLGEVLDNLKGNATHRGYELTLPHGSNRLNVDLEPNVSRSLQVDDDFSMSVQAPVSIPASKDWRTSGCVAAPINQEKCGCCYAVATMGVLETMRCINRVSSPILSSQQIIDCSTPRAGYQNFGCDGGWPTRVLKYLQNVRVAARETCYPLVKRQETCKLNRVKNIEGCSVPASISDSSLRFKVLNNERDILYHVATTGPVITVMRATDKFLYYGSGIFDDPKCTRKADDVDHAISIVGYGRENGQDYWLIKNSWGSDWGQDGYGKYKRGTHACSIGHWGWVILS